MRVGKFYTIYNQALAYLFRLTSGAAAIIPGVEDPKFVTQTRPRPGATAAEQLNGTLDSIWWRLFVDPGLVFLALGGLAVIVLINAGMHYIAAGGNPEQAKKGQAQILHTVLAIILIVSAYTIIRFISGLGVMLLPDNWQPNP